MQQQKKALLQRDLARKTHREVDVPRLYKAQVETAWQRAKIEMETDDALGALADNPCGKGDVLTEYDNLIEYNNLIYCILSSVVALC